MNISNSLKRVFVLSIPVVAALMLTACTTTQSADRKDLTDAGVAGNMTVAQVPTPQLKNTDSKIDLASAYAAVDDEGFKIPAVPYKKMNPEYLRQEVTSPYNEKPGTIIINTATRHLYLIEENGVAMRYGVGIGRQGFAWTGDGVIQWKQTWPKWFPPKEMIARQPQLAKFSADNGGMPPGLGNALGSRAMYIFRDGKDTLYRLHGTQEWASIGKAVSSGCVRILNQDVIDLYNRVRPGAKVIVR